jgi:hypothetical protein
MIVTLRKTKYGINVFSYFYVFQLNESSKATFTKEYPGSEPELEFLNNTEGKTEVDLKSKSGFPHGPLFFKKVQWSYFAPMEVGKNFLAWAGSDSEDL